MKTRGYRSGDYYVHCDRCGCRFYRSEMRRQWDGVMVDSRCYDSKHPQLELRARADKQGVKDARPSNDEFLTTPVQASDLNP